MELTPQQKGVFDFICAHHRRDGFSPTVWEICGKLGLAGPAGVHRMLGVLEKKGYVRVIQMTPDNRDRLAGRLIGRIDTGTVHVHPGENKP